MQETNHWIVRKNQRAISKRMIELTLENGRDVGDEIILDRKQVNLEIEKRELEIRHLKKMRDKGGVVVVHKGRFLITTYNYTGSIN